MSEHYKEICRDCETVISQCRCAGPKTIRLGLCQNRKTCRKRKNALKFVALQK
ncbi:MAG: hypothetical protein UW79_C0001G0030 [Candidatus Yanofskybacteria bacterium GW2011_GWA2_44_9]|uniref:Uncharacterized protein n=1 Tax=Candidatus Yanofskybacteria bacterium GW2011_GWA2_44_9 TaxID=1619025 RepID=A0A0G1NEZ8_9BACT|nr:MAG: hypothetical protein UW79_C0001G0030 [Candidatus Yanofskybacteria bacterium GW2011_GWA2_44_9]